MCACVRASDWQISATSLPSRRAQKGINVNNNQTPNDNLPDAGISPSVHIAHLAFSITYGHLVLAWKVETSRPSQEYEISNSFSEVAVSVVDVTGQQLRRHENPTDEDIHAAATLRLEWDLAVPLQCVRVEVCCGAVTLTGEVDCQGQRLAAERDVIQLNGVTRVFNRITVRKEGDECHACDRIGHAAHASWLFEPKILQFPR